MKGEMPAVQVEVQVEAQVEVEGVQGVGGKDLEPVLAVAGGPHLALVGMYLPCVGWAHLHLSGSWRPAAILTEVPPLRGLYS